MYLFLTCLIVALTVVFMEAWAWFSHKYLLHGPLWFLHKSHHSVNDTWWEWNDLVSVVYGLASAIFIIIGSRSEALWWLMGIGIGIAAYGIVYFLFHDIIIHRRIKLSYSAENSYIRRLIRAHKIHHKHLEQNPGEAYGFLYASKKYEVKRVDKSGRS